MKADQKETAVFEKRLWVRLTRTCNNHCLFCLDSPSQDGSIVPSIEITDRIKKGREEGTQRLILSGGEPTIHPDFLKFVDLGRKLDFDWIQVITNGRMFSYKDFAKKSVSAGVNEVTVSIHGHTEELHDRLTGVKGAFRQAISGIKNLFNTKRCVVNIDIVVNKMNYRYLAEIVEYFYDMGIREFDILHMIPHGRGFDENKDMLFFDLQDAYPYLTKAFEIRKRQGVFMWTNRMPAIYLEGAEDLIQDPHKIYDEVFGEREIFRDLLKKGQTPICFGERCNYCFLRDFCECLLELYKNLKKIKHKKSLENYKFKHTIPLTKNNINSLAKRYLKIDENSMQLKIMNYETLSEIHEKLPVLSQIIEFVDKFSMPVLNLPKCLHEKGISPKRTGGINQEVFDKNGSIDLKKFTQSFIVNEYYIKSLRCRDCKFTEECRGIHINFARRFGLKILKPMK